MISKHSAHSTSLPVGFRTWLWRYTCLLLLISMLWHRQAIFEWKGDKLFTSAECRIRTQGLRHLFASRLNACWQTDWSIQDQANKLELDSPSLWSASIQPTWPHCHLAYAPGSSDIHICCCEFRCSGTGKRFSNQKETSCLPLLKAGFELRGSQTPIRQQTECLLTNRLSYQGSSKNLNSTARPYDQQAFSPPDPTAIWHSHLALAIYTFVVVNFDALAQASDFRIERSQVVFLCCRQDSNNRGSQTPIRQQTECLLTNRLSYRGSSKNLNSTARPYDQQAFSPPDPTAIWHSHLALAIYTFVVVNFDALAQASDFRIERRQVVFLCWRQDSNPEGLRHLFANRLNACWQTDWAIEDQAKTRTRQPVPMINKHSAHSTSLTVGFRTWLWRYTHLLLWISMLWHRQAIFESKGDELSSSAEGRIRTQRVSYTYSSADWMLADKPTELSRIKQNLELDSPSLWSASIQPTWPHSHLSFAPGSGDIHICCC